MITQKINNERRNTKISSKLNDNRGLPWKPGEMPLEIDLALELFKFFECHDILWFFSWKYK